MTNDGSRTRRAEGATARARRLRQGGNIAEAQLWNELKDRKLAGHKFVRQLPIGPFTADFACRSARLVVEIDGSQHVDSDRDRLRDDFMTSEGWSVVRMWNVDVLKNLASVCDTILAAVEGRLQPDVAADLRYVVPKITRNKQK